METVCRAITFINYHIPLTENLGEVPQYSTVGFFDGMFTEKLTVDYGKYDLKNLWKYNIRKTSESQGKFSYQNIFCFSQDNWNHYTDTEFWLEDSDFDYPLLFVVFLQLSDYMTGDNSIKQQCSAFNDVLRKNLDGDGKYYTYGTIDKNDFVVCIRSQNHTQAVNAIKKLHSTQKSVVYSYSVLSIANRVLDVIDETYYPYLYEQLVDSICFKGITNSFNPDKNITLDQRYYEFCDKLIDKLYPAGEKSKPEEEREYRIYDILGDDDFRLIARHVNLGKLLREFRKGGQLGYIQSDLRFYLYSSSLVLNTMTKPQPRIDSVAKSKTITQMNREMRSPLCEQLECQMTKIFRMLKDDSMDEKIVTFCQALWQLLQSLKVLECAPTKKYDFYSLYHPFATLVRILEGKMRRDELGSNNQIYEFIHKISMTLHGTLRTDIQFFQIRDFNVIVHYAPAKLRAFYAIWALKLSEFYNSFEETSKKYSFILSPGVFGETHVKQLFVKYDEPERLMLITTPERNLYTPRWLSVIIAHEVSHFVGTKIRERMYRHKVLLRISAYIASLEMENFWYIGMPEHLKASTEKLMKESSYLRSKLEKELIRVDKEVNDVENAYPYLYHSGESRNTICKDYRYITNNDIDRKIVSDYGEMLKNILRMEAGTSGRRNNIGQLSEDLDICNEREKKVLLFFERFQQTVLSGLLQMLLNYMCAETFADMIAILTLDLSPAEYVTSFVRNEYLENEQNQEQKSMRLLPVRIAITMEAVMMIVHKNQEWLKTYGSKLVETWVEDVFRTTISELNDNPSAQDIMLRVYGYKTNLVRKNKCIRRYASMYNPKDGTFSNKRFDFLNDTNIYKFLCRYLYKCADTYFVQIKFLENGVLRDMREKLINTYQTLAQGSVTDVMQQVEDFLHEHESS